ncbi:hypothetical protein HYR69_06115 [Candidatus Sumerlaeota bacterium]|nr:hypothetical protein [Candidatus Sumerlaeota bacterium]MBI3737082.1 hypothetical protein [Candidatus Sumerlaeota bacterium]
MAKKKKEEAKAAEVELIGEMDVQKMLTGNQNKYLMINVIASRAADLKRGARALVDLDQSHTTLELALAEGLAGALKVVKKQKESKVVNLVENE